MLVRFTELVVVLLLGYVYPQLQLGTCMQSALHFAPKSSLRQYATCSCPLLALLRKLPALSTRMPPQLPPLRCCALAPLQTYMPF